MEQRRHYHTSNAIARKESDHEPEKAWSGTSGNLKFFLGPMRYEGITVGVGDSSPTNGPVVQRLARPSGIRETRGSIPGLAFSFSPPTITVYSGTVKVPDEVDRGICASITLARAAVSRV